MFMGGGAALATMLGALARATTLEGAESRRGVWKRAWSGPGEGSGDDCPLLTLVLGHLWVWSAFFRAGALEPWSSSGLGKRQARLTLWQSGNSISGCKCEGESQFTYCGILAFLHHTAQDEYRVQDMVYSRVPLTFTRRRRQV